MTQFIMSNKSNSDWSIVEFSSQRFPIIFGIIQHCICSYGLPTATVTFTSHGDREDKKDRKVKKVQEKRGNIDDISESR